MFLLVSVHRLMTVFGRLELACADDMRLKSNYVITFSFLLRSRDRQTDRQTETERDRDKERDKYCLITDAYVNIYFLML